MDKVIETFVPAEDPEGSERITIADQPIVIYKPRNNKVAGLTFVVTAANIPLSKYASIISALNSADHVVVGFFVNVINPPLSNHRIKAERIPMIFHELKDDFKVNSYDIVGHSVGGKIALLVAALYDEEHLVRNITALDPVDQSPVEFTNTVTKPSAVTKTTKKGRTNLSLESSRADITLTFTDSGYFIGKKHNAREIQKNNPSAKIVLHRNSCHMVYCDDGGLLSWKALMGRGSSSDRNKVVREQTLQLIKDRIMQSSVTGNASGAVKSKVGKARKSISNKMKEAKEMKEEAQSKGKAFAGAAQAIKVMG